VTIVMAVNPASSPLAEDKSVVKPCTGPYPWKFISLFQYHLYFLMIRSTHEWNDHLEWMRHYLQTEANCVVGCAERGLCRHRKEYECHRLCVSGSQAKIESPV